MQVRFSPAASQDLANLHRFLSRDGGEIVADSYIERIVRSCRNLEHFPRRGRSRDDIAKGLRIIGFERRAVIAFFVMSDHVMIEAVLYGGRDLEQAMENRGTSPG